MEQSKFTLDSQIFLTLFILLVIGVVMVYSASSFKAQEAYDNSHYFFKQHFFRVLGGFVMMLVVARIDYRFWFKLSPILLIISVGLLLFLLISDSVTEIRGSRRWLMIGSFHFQPSDFARISLILFLSLLWGSEKINKEYKTALFVMTLAIIGIIILPILLQPDMGTALLITCIALLMLFLAGEKIKHFLLLGFSALPVFLMYLSKGNQYWLLRIKAFIASLTGEQVAWQTQQSLIAFGNGHITGVGLGSGKQKYHFLPDPFTDFIYAIIGEELGLIGSVTVLVLIFIFIWAGFRIALNAPETRGRLLGMGIVLSVAIYAVVNASVVLSLMPTTGIPMPFLSYGGSALLAHLFGVGILLNMSSQIRDRSRLYPVYKKSYLRNANRRHAKA